MRATAQFREGFFISCWYLFDEEHANIWRLYGEDGVAVFSRYDLLKTALNSLDDEAFLGLVRYGSWHLTGWNIMRFITTKREEFDADRRPAPFCGSEMSSPASIDISTPTTGRMDDR